MPATNAQKAKADSLLKQMGWQKISNNDRYFRFQQGFGFGALSMDNDPGDLTISAMEFSLAKNGALTEHFYWREFACKHCGEVRVHRDLGRGLEVVRARFMPSGITILSGCRCDAHNRNVGGSTRSAHLSGGACDFKGPTLKDMMSLNIFSGLGATTNDEINRHADVRGVDKSVPNHSGGQPGKPTLWGYNARTFKTTGALAHWSRYPATGPGLPALGTWKGNFDSPSKPRRPLPPVVGSAPSKPLVLNPPELAPQKDNKLGREVSAIRQGVVTVEKATEALSARLSKVEGQL